MAASNPDQLVLDDSLFILYMWFNSGMDVNTLHKNTRKNLFAVLSKIKLPVAFNTDQIRRHKKFLRKILPAETLTGMLAAGSAGTLEDTALDTVHGIILTRKTTNLPYVNIHDPDIDTNFSITVTAGQSRNSIVHHIAKLAKKAIKLHLYDKYLDSKFKKIPFVDLLQYTSADIVCHGENKKMARELRKYLARNHVQKTVIHVSHSYHTMHDRYLIIEYPTHSYEIILSSGFEYLFSDRKEITCVFRKK